MGVATGIKLNAASDTKFEIETTSWEMPDETPTPKADVEKEQNPAVSLATASTESTQPSESTV
jgi:hypothetical protein